jgi:hypothetical protein
MFHTQLLFDFVPTHKQHTNCHLGVTIVNLCTEFWYKFVLRNVHCDLK